jgi:DNA modification methylase
MSATAPPFYRDASDSWGILEGEALQLLRRLPDQCVDALVGDPPYGINFHGEAWDGADILAAGRTSTEATPPGEAFERWNALWAHECLRVMKPGAHVAAFGSPRTFHRLVAGVEDAGFEVRDQLLWLFSQGMPKSRLLEGGLGSTLKPTFEPILLARRPFAGTLAKNLSTHGSGALNIDAARIARADGARGYWPATITASHTTSCTGEGCAPGCPVRLVDDQSDGRPLSRLFHCAKATRAEREAGCEGLPPRALQVYRGKHHRRQLVCNVHPTVKPLELMRWLVRLIAPPGGLVLDPFAGSGSTGAAAVLEGRRFLGIERDGEYVDIACARLTHWAKQAGEESG